MYQTIVVGAGVIGAAVARELARAGLAVTVLDRAGAAGATTAHGEGNVLLSDKGPGPELELARVSRTAWPEIVAQLGGATTVEWDPKGGIVVATTESGARELEVFTDGQRSAGVKAERMDTAAVASAEPNLTREITAAWHYPQDAQVQPAGAATALLADAVAAGAVVETHTTVNGALVEKGRIRGVRTAKGIVNGDIVVNAAGPWAGKLAESFGAPIDVRPRRGEVLVTTPLPPTVFHKVYDADYVGAVGSDNEDLQASAVVESTRAGTVLLGSSRRRVGFDERTRPEVLAVIARKAARLFPCLATVSVMRCYGGFRPYVPDHLPVIGADPRIEGLWHATGHEGAGIGLSVGTAMLVRQGILGQQQVMDAGPFRVDREAVIGR